MNICLYIYIYISSNQIIRVIRFPSGRRDPETEFVLSLSLKEKNSLTSSARLSQYLIIKAFVYHLLQFHAIFFLKNSS